MRDWTTKDLRKAAFAVGFGLTFGKSIGDFVDMMLGCIETAVIKSFANHGNKIAQELCKKSNIEYEVKSKKKN